MAFTNEEILTKRLVEEFTALGIKEDEIKSASHKAWDELIASRNDMMKKGEETLKYMEETSAGCFLCQPVRSDRDHLQLYVLPD